MAKKNHYTYERLELGLFLATVFFLFYGMGYYIMFDQNQTLGHYLFFTIIIGMIVWGGYLLSYKRHHP